eukprot:TRINITY_DN7912_c0_g1_i1.p1 TRINITY_DN7912_c0_g1~~TRINITY_DN7912_c0_g1_i1.p1  ORF type:complete len:322 (+),score=30.86 TRINITY_DN7912_c0_g1_i1:1-966(+)
MLKVHMADSESIAMTKQLKEIENYIIVSNEEFRQQLKIAAPDSGSSKSTIADLLALLGSEDDDYKIFSFSQTSSNSSISPRSSSHTDIRSAKQHKFLRRVSQRYSHTLVQKLDNMPDPDRGDKAKAKRRDGVIAEFVHTEKKYVEDMVMILQVYKKGILDNNLLSKEDTCVLFGNLEDIVKVNKKFCQLLDREKDKTAPRQQFGQLVYNMYEEFHIYSTYCSNYEQSRLLLKAKYTDNTADSNKLAKFIGSLEREQKMPLSSHLIKPLQRIAKYPILLKELVNHTDNTHADYKNLFSAGTKMNILLNEIDANLVVLDTKRS